MHFCLSRYSGDPLFLYKAPGVFLSAIVMAAVLAESAGAAATRSTSESRQPERVSIQAAVNGLFVSVHDSGTLAPRSAIVGSPEQFELYELGKGVIALKAVANGKYVTVRTSGPLVADAGSIGPAQTFHRVGGGKGLARLRAVSAKNFVCAAAAGDGPMTTEHGCAHEWQVLRIAGVEAAPFTIATPAPFSTLRATTVTFRWDAAGDEYWLNIGTAPGRADIHASSSLGPATEHTVSRLPLNGAPLYAELRRRVGTVVQAVTVQYTAPIRKGVLVITDFVDRRLEDWTGAGMKNVEDVSVQLREMEDHWSWLSRGLEKFQWDIIRVRLDQPAVPGAFPGWSAFRDAAITLAREQINVGDYDVNGDGVIDAVWLIVSSGDAPVGDYAIGGMSRNAGANLFVDGQASGSVIAGATGNFNHELGHCLGLPDLYGPYDSVHTLTVMSYSWPVPPPDFTAYERTKLGWIEPQVIGETTSALWLPNNDTMAAVKVPTANPSEYFLIEYRRRPSSGYGSVDPPYNGLAVYHVLEGSSMWQDPPLLKLEPADGHIVPGPYPIDVKDFLSPDNPYFVQPMVLYSYYGDDQEVFRIHNVRWLNGGMAFDVAIAGAQQASPNLLVNGSFENGHTGRPDGWVAGSYVPMPDGFVWPSADASDGHASAHLVSTSNDMFWSQSVTVVPGQTYELCGSLKGEGIAGGSTGGNLSLLGGWVATESILGTVEWTTRCLRFTAETARVDVACRLGFYGSTVSGKLWCDALTLQRLRSAF